MSTMDLYTILENEPMKYPILNISLEKWNNSEIDLTIILLYEEIIYTSDENLYKKFFLNNKYVDSNGDIYKITGRILPAHWKKIFSFLPNFYKVKLNFEKIEESILISELKIYIINKINQYDNIKDLDKNWLNRIENATSFEQVLEMIGNETIS